MVDASCLVCCSVSLLHGSLRPDGLSLCRLVVGCDPWWPPREAVRVSVFLPFQFLCSTPFSRSGFARHFFLESDDRCHSRLLVGSSAFVTDRGFLWPFPDLVRGSGFLKLTCFLPAFPLGVTGWLTIEHGHFVRFVDGGFGPVRMCVAGGGGGSVVFTCFSVGGTVLNGVTVRLFFTAGGIGDPRVVFIFCLSPGGSGLSFCPLLCPCSAGSARRGPPCWRRGRVVVVERFSASSCSLTVSSPLFVVPSWYWVLPPSWAGTNTGISGGRRPGRGESTVLPQLALHGDLLGQLFCWFVLTASATLRVCWRVP